MSKVRVYEVARDLNVDQDHLVGVLQSLGFNDVRNRMSKVDADAVERVRRHIENQQRTPEVVEERLSATVVKRRDFQRLGLDTLDADVVAHHVLDQWQLEAEPRLRLDVLDLTEL
ncbi:MAG: hypothetical protein CVU63_05965, partial [Deltaproteobacteria bacterium HGW-Deltaproteobacteria-20]